MDDDQQWVQWEQDEMAEWLAWHEQQGEKYAEIEAQKHNEAKVFDGWL